MTRGGSKPNQRAPEGRIVGDALSGDVVVLAIPYEAVQEVLGTYGGTLVEGQVAGQPLDVFLASDDADAKGVVSRLVEDGGQRAIDAGPLARAHELEAVGYLHMALQQPLGAGFGSAVKVLT